MLPCHISVHTCCRFLGPYLSGNPTSDSQLIKSLHRLNIFGFPHSPVMGDATANAVLRDLRRALEWLRDFARAFSGNSTRTVALGHSAGRRCHWHAAVCERARPI